MSNPREMTTYLRTIMLYDGAGRLINHVAENLSNVIEDQADLIDELKEALNKINDAHIPDQPATYGGDELEWAHRHVRTLRNFARDALDKAANIERTKHE